jgi:hypothetical protein
MTDIRGNSGVVTQITTVKLSPDNQKEVVDLFHGKPAWIRLDQSSPQ